MKISLQSETEVLKKNDLGVISAYYKKGANPLVNSHWPKELKEAFKAIKGAKSFEGKKGETYSLNLYNKTVTIVGLGEKTKVDHEVLRGQFANLLPQFNKYQKVGVHLDAFLLKGNMDLTVTAISEGLLLGEYKFDKHLSEKKKSNIKEVNLYSKENKAKLKPGLSALDRAEIVCDSVNLCRDFVNEPPNVLNSETYAKRVEQDAKKIKGVKVKVLGKGDLKKEKMNMFLSVNAGSAYEPRLVHLTYTPPKKTKKTKHIALVGKGLTFDTGGYSLKPGGSMINMKFDMAGSATMYAAFRAIAKLRLNVKVSCYLGMTDNAVNSLATMPDSIVKARNGKTVEILNTDAEGRLVLGDVLSYACDHKPDHIIDAATLTGACLVALGTEVCGVMGNDQKLVDKLLKSASETSEYMWQLPIIPEFRKDMTSDIADLKNLGGSRFGGTAKAAAFLENFVTPETSWAHLDIAGIGDSQGHLPYCPKKGASGSIVRSLIHFANNV